MVLFLAGYSFEIKSKSKQEAYAFYIAKLDENVLKEVEIIKEAAYLARDFANKPTNLLNPSMFVKKIEEIFKIFR